MDIQLASQNILTWYKNLSSASTFCLRHTEIIQESWVPHFSTDGKMFASHFLQCTQSSFSTFGKESFIHRLHANTTSFMDPIDSDWELLLRFPSWSVFLTLKDLLFSCVLYYIANSFRIGIIFLSFRVIKWYAKWISTCQTDDEMTQK